MRAILVSVFKFDQLFNNISESILSSFIIIILELSVIINTYDILFAFITIDFAHNFKQIIIFQVSLYCVPKINTYDNYIWIFFPEFLHCVFAATKTFRPIMKE